jgi:stage V sporulation protein AB
VFGAIVADILSVFPITGSIGFMPQSLLVGLLIIIGVFAGIFVGCLAIALSEVLDGIPIFARRVKLKKGVSLAVIAVAVGKLVGSFIYFINGFYAQTF